MISSKIFLITVLHFLGLGTVCGPRGNVCVWPGKIGFSRFCRPRENLHYINIGPQLETIRGDYANRRARKNCSYHKRRRNGDRAYRGGVVPRGKGVERME